MVHTQEVAGSSPATATNRPRHPCRVVGCTEPQVRAFELIARGMKSHATAVTLAALEMRGLIERIDGGYRAVSEAVDGWRRWRELERSWRYKRRR